MIFFYRVRANFITVPQNHIVYLTQAQRQRYSDLDLEEYDYVKPGWVCCLSWEGITVGCGELLGLREVPPPEVLGGLVAQWVREWPVLGNGSLPSDGVGLHWERLRELSRQHFHAVTGMTFSDFHEKTSQLARASWEKQQRGGRREKCWVEDYFYLTLLYRQGKGSYQALAKAYGMSVSRLYEIVQWVEKILLLPEIKGVTK